MTGSYCLGERAPRSAFNNSATQDKRRITASPQLGYIKEFHSDVSNPGVATLFDWWGHNEHTKTLITTYTGNCSMK